MKCPRCGAENPNVNELCSFCDQRLRPARTKRDDMIQAFTIIAMLWLLLVILIFYVVILS